MRKLIICTLLFLLAACSAKDGLPSIPPADTNCVQPNQTQPIDGGLGGTGVLPEENCPTNDGQI